MTCSLQDVGHYRPLSELTLLSWAVFILHGCFLCCSSQCSCWGESSLLSSFPFNIIHSEVSVQHQSHRQYSWFLHYLIRLKDRGWAIGDFTLGKEIDLWNNQSVGSGRIFFKKKMQKGYCHFWVDLNQGACAKFFFSACDCGDLTMGQKWILC